MSALIRSALRRSVPRVSIWVGGPPAWPGRLTRSVCTRQHVRRARDHQRRVEKRHVAVADPYLTAAGAQAEPHGAQREAGIQVERRLAADRRVQRAPAQPATAPHARSHSASPATAWRAGASRWHPRPAWPTVSAAPAARRLPDPARQSRPRRLPRRRVRSISACGARQVTPSWRSTTTTRASWMRTRRSCPNSAFELRARSLPAGRASSASRSAIGVACSVGAGSPPSVASVRLPRSRLSVPSAARTRVSCGASNVDRPRHDAPEQQFVDRQRYVGARDVHAPSARLVDHRDVGQPQIERPIDAHAEALPGQRGGADRQPRRAAIGVGRILQPGGEPRQIDRPLRQPPGERRDADAAQHHQRDRQRDQPMQCHRAADRRLTGETPHAQPSARMTDTIFPSAGELAEPARHRRRATSGRALRRARPRRGTAGGAAGGRRAAGRSRRQQPVPRRSRGARGGQPARAGRLGTGRRGRRGDGGTGGDRARRPAAIGSPPRCAAPSVSSRWPPPSPTSAASGRSSASPRR